MDRVKAPFIVCATLVLLPLLGCEVRSGNQSEYATVRQMTHQDVQAHNYWVSQKKRRVEPKPFEGRPITVSGQGRVKAMPDIAVITGLITKKAEADDIAVSGAADIINSVQQALVSTNADLNFTQISAIENRDDDCQKDNLEALNRFNAIVADNQYNAQIKRQRDQGINTSKKPRAPQTRIAQKLCPVLDTEARIGFALRIKPASKAADIISALTDAGVESVDLYGYDYDDYDALYKQAATKAVKDARAKAEMIARRAGTPLTEITNFSVDLPDRTARFGPQAMIISNHGNRNVAAGSYNTSETLVVGSAGATYDYIPPVFETVTETVVVQEASTELVTIPATYDTVTETVVVQPQYVRGDGTIEPAVTKQVLRRVVKTPASTTERVIPAVTKQATRRIIKTPARAIEKQALPDNTSNALKMSLAGARTITVSAQLTYAYETPIDGTLPQKPLK